MKEKLKLKLKDDSVLSLDVIALAVNETFVRIEPLLKESDQLFYLKINHQQLNTFVDLTGSNPCIVLYFDENLAFEGASYNSISSDSFYCIQTQSKKIVLAKLPQKLPINSILNMSVLSETLDFISYENFLSKLD